MELKLWKSNSKKNLFFYLWTGFFRVERFLILLIILSRYKNIKALYVKGFNAPVGFLGYTCGYQCTVEGTLKSTDFQKCHFLEPWL